MGQLEGVSYNWFLLLLIIQSIIHQKIYTYIIDIWVINSRFLFRKQHYTFPFHNAKLIIRPKTLTQHSTNKKNQPIKKKHLTHNQNCLQINNKYSNYLKRMSKYFNDNKNV